MDVAADSARQAYDRGDWPEAYDAWAGADLDHLAATDLADHPEKRAGSPGVAQLIARRTAPRTAPGGSPAGS